ncbi:hypothetical protein [Lysobacter auxotrophicus]|uniref:hypothetical protein n=1 Tax=Lysobacter auxotrophicus TaxID=2992573 RepID=UPI003CCDB667
MHAISRSQLTRLLASWRTVQSKVEFRISETPVYASTGTGLFGYRERVDAYVGLVEDAVGSEAVQRTTLIPIRPSLAPQCVGSVKSLRAWCEACFEEDLQCMEVPYDRFLWTLAPINRCHLHRLRLRDRCPVCGSEQRFHHRTGNPQLCVKCGRGLVGPLGERTVEITPAFGEADCVELVKSISEGAIANTRSDALFAFEETLHSVLSPLAGAVRGISENSGSARASRRNVRPSLITLLKKAFTAGVRLVDLLTDPEGAAMIAGQLFYDRHQLPVSIRPNHGERIREEMELKLKEQLLRPASEVIPPLREIAKHLGVSESYIRRQVPTLVKKYQSRRRGAAVAIANRKRGLCRAELEKCLAHKRGSRVWSHRKELEAHLVIATGCSYPTARSAIAHALSKMAGTRDACTHEEDLWDSDTSCTDADTS